MVRFGRFRAGGVLLLAALGACQPEAKLPSAPGPTASPFDAGELGLDAAETDAAPPSGQSDAGADAAHVSPGPGELDASPALFLRLPDPVANLPRGEEQRRRLCARGRDDLVVDAFCADVPPRVTSLAELLTLLDVSPKDYIGSRGFAISGHSTSLSKRSVSAINPRVIFMHVEAPTEPLLSVAFTRGEPIVELVVRSRASRELQFYVVTFALPCQHDCSPGELLTSAIERDWQSVDVYHEEDLKNTTVDCRVCHQPAGPASPKLLRMQELETPWTHWFDEQTRGGRALLEDYYALHGMDAFAGIVGSDIGQARGGLAAAFVRIAGSDVQPNEFNTKLIEGEVERNAPAQPADNSTRGQSETWRIAYQAALRAEAIPVPYHDVKVTDPVKLARVQRTYAEYRAGRLPQRALPDLRDVFPDDPITLAELGFTPDERLDDRALLTAACGLCHNARLDQSQSRARFHTELERLSPEQKQTAIDRLNLQGDDPAAMPPRRIYELTESARARLVSLLGR
ncbi:MAG TPA: hypothetical protein VFZ61_30560 [Polyangiales bacterium]